jgi:hypothetical protein
VQGQRSLGGLAVHPTITGVSARCFSYQAVVSTSPARKAVQVVKPNSSRTGVVSRQRLG